MLRTVKLHPVAWGHGISFILATIILTLFHLSGDPALLTMVGGQVVAASVVHHVPAPKK